MPQSAVALLSYTLDCTPNPLYISTQQEKAVGQLTLEVGLPLDAYAGAGLMPADTGWDSGPSGTGGGILNSNGTVSVWCKWFDVVIPIGDKPTDLANIPDTSSLQTITIYAPSDTWEYAARLFQAPAGQWNAGIRFTPIDRYGDPTTYQFNGTNPVNVSIGNIPINATPGFAVVSITENTSETPGTGVYIERQAEREAPKAEKDFYFYDLHPTRPFVVLGQAPILQWKGNVANSSFTVGWYDGTGYREAEVAGQSWQCPQGQLPQNTTTFIVGATYVPPGQSKAVTVHLTTTVTVTNPVIQATSITSTGDVTITAGSTLRTDKIAKASAAAITVTDHVSATTITASGDINSQSTLRARQVTSDTSITASGDITIQGANTLRTDKIAKASAAAITITDHVSATTIAASGAITATGDVISHATLRGNTIGRVSGSGAITINDNLTLLYGITATSASGTIRARQLTSDTTVTASGSVTASGTVTSAGKRLIGIGDEIALRNYSNNSGPYYLYCLSGGAWLGGSSGSPYIVGNRSNSYNNSNWTVIGVWDTAADDDSVDGTNEPDA